MTHQYEQMSWVVYQYYHIFIMAPNSWWIFKRLGKQRQSAVTKSILMKFNLYEACKVDELSIKWHGTWPIDCTMSRQQVATTNTSLQTIVCFFLWRNYCWKEGYFVKWHHSLRKKSQGKTGYIKHACTWRLGFWQNFIAAKVDTALWNRSLQIGQFNWIL